MRNWTNRHDGHPLIAKQIAFARDSSSFELLYRGDKGQRPAEVFTFGVKARPALYEGDLSKLEWELTLVADNDQKWADVLRAFLHSPMGRRMAKLDRLASERLMREYDESSEKKRRRLAELLLLGLQYQNYQQSVEQWRELLFLISCSRDDTIALRYALWFKKPDCPPQRAFIYDYAPPSNDSLHEPASAMLREFEDLGLHRAFPDKDKEFFVKMAMLPHYILGYAELRRIDLREYETKYHPSPHYADGGHTLDHPPKLTSKQLRLMNETKGKVAWLWWIREEDTWIVDANVQP